MAPRPPRACPRGAARSRREGRGCRRRRARPRALRGAAGLHIGAQLAMRARSVALPGRLSPPPAGTLARRADPSGRPPLAGQRATRRDAADRAAPRPTHPSAHSAPPLSLPLSCCSEPTRCAPRRRLPTRPAAVAPRRVRPPPPFYLRRPSDDAPPSAASVPLRLFTPPSCTTRSLPPARASRRSAPRARKESQRSLSPKSSYSPKISYKTPRRRLLPRSGDGAGSAGPGGGRTAVRGAGAGEALAVGEGVGERSRDLQGERAASRFTALQSAGAGRARRRRWRAWGDGRAGRAGRLGAVRVGFVELDVRGERCEAVERPASHLRPPPPGSQPQPPLPLRPQPPRPSSAATPSAATGRYKSRQDGTRQGGAGGTGRAASRATESSAGTSVSICDVSD
jgi:hypothetical protein